MTNLVKLIRREQVERLTSTFHGERASEVHCYSTPIYNLVKCRLMDEFCYLNFMKFTLLGFHLVVLVKTFPLMYQLAM